MAKIFFFLAGFTVTFLLAHSLYTKFLPSEASIKGCFITKMNNVKLCPGSKNYVPIEQISSPLQKAILLSEDSAFYDHNGFSWDSIEKNALEGWANGTFKRGGSTITQQLTKNMFLSKEKTFARKAMEALITDKIERTLKKKEILERYLNVAEFGKDLYGIKAASQYYFNKTPKELDLVQSAFLAMLLPNPVKYSTSFLKKQLSPFARNRMNRLIDDMFQYHQISQEQYEVAKTELAAFLPSNESVIDTSENQDLEPTRENNEEFFPEEKDME